MRYRYVKKEKVKVKLVYKLIPIFLMIIGMGMMFSAAGPILYYQFFKAPKFQELVTPLPLKPQVLAETAGNVDYTKVSNWFPEAPKLPTRPSSITHYNLSIPKLGIKKAVVEIDGEDLKKSLVHYEGTAYPGQFGTAVVFGHSALPQFFSSTNYTTIFTTLPTLKKNDEIFIDFDGVTYKYIVFDLSEVSPKDMSILKQNYDDSYLKLVTCVPPGTYLKRLVVSLKLKSL